MVKAIEEEKLSKAEQHMIEEFQCPGCVAGSDIKCGAFKFSKNNGVCCTGHVPGTMILGLGSILLGMPKGFNRVGDWRGEGGFTRDDSRIRLFTKGEAPEWNDLNVPVWAMVEKGYLYVRTYSPRTNRTFIDVVEGGTLELVPKAIDVGKFKDEID